MEKRNLEQRCAIKFCVKLNENATETYEKLKSAYREHASSRTWVFRWHKAFLDGRESVEDEPRSGRPCTLYVVPLFVWMINVQNAQFVHLNTAKSAVLTDT
jgi:hypothetical protein